MKFRVTVCEMNDDPTRFEEDWTRLVMHVEKESSDLVLLPEMPFYFWFSAGPKYVPKIWDDAVKASARWERRIPELAPATVAWTSPVDIGNSRFNIGFAWDKERGKREAHTKGYLPDEPGYYEARWYQRGDRSFSPIEVAGSMAGFMICSDLWALGHARSYGKGGTRMLLVPRATGKTTTDKWIAGGRTAAVVSGAFCLSSNRIGRRGAATFGGSGWAIGPDGDVLGITTRKKPFLTLEIDLKDSDKAKNSYPRDVLEPD